VWAEALEDGDKIATRLIDRAVVMLAAGVASVQNVLDLEAAVIGGGLADRLGPSFVERIAKACTRTCSSTNTPGRPAERARRPRRRDGRGAPRRRRARRARLDPA
jgi:predicted NBD/HSP70 family sugar kinase